MITIWILEVDIDGYVTLLATGTTHLANRSYMCRLGRLVGRMSSSVEEESVEMAIMADGWASSGVCLL